MRILTPLAWAAATTLLLAACAQDDPAPPPPTRPPTSTESSPTPSPTPTPPTLPASATPDARGAETFVRHFWSVFNYTYATNDTRPLKSISAPDCTFCQSTITQVDKWKSQGAHVEGGSVEVSSVVAPPVDVREGALVTVLMQQRAGRVLSATGEQLSEGAGVTNRRSDVLVDYRDGAWRMRGVSFGGPEGDS